MKFFSVFLFILITIFFYRHSSGNQTLLNADHTPTPLMKSLLKATDLPVSKSTDEILLEIGKKWDRNAEHRQDMKKIDLSPKVFSLLKSFMFEEVLPKTSQKHYPTALILASTFQNVFERLVFSLKQGFYADSYVFLTGKRELYHNEDFTHLCKNQTVLGITFKIKQNLICSQLKAKYKVTTEDEMIKFLWEAFDWEEIFPFLTSSKSIYIIVEHTFHGRRPNTLDTLLEAKKFFEKKVKDRAYVVSNQFYGWRQYKEAKAILGDFFSQLDLIAEGKDADFAKEKALDILNELKVGFWVEYYGKDYEKYYFQNHLGKPIHF
ncbi:MAG: hypothetical protein K2X39_08395 [Silvanigrellaceae bacterium]|nr:hypothetical protein [Silvanigrellaceae bacterium]